MRNRRGESRTHHVPRLEGSFERDVPNLGGRRFSATPIPLGDEPADGLLRDILAANLDRRSALEALRDWVRRALESAELRDLVEDHGRGVLFGRRSRARIDYRARGHTRTLRRAALHLDD